ncbi:MAG: methylase, partial [Clostridia bacterium]|nr:methylase [Clostridia bacterium]
MKDTEIRQHAKAFAEYWKDKGYEQGESQPFWLSLLRDVLGVAEPEKFIQFEEQVMIDHTSFIDGHIPATHVLIEQKSRDKDLRKPIKQSDGSLLNPFQQAQRYSAGLPYSQRPRWIVTCNFNEILVYDMENPKGE